MVVLSLPGSPERGRGISGKAGPSWGGKAHTHSSKLSQRVCSPLEGPRLPKQRVGFKLREGLLSRRQSPHATALPAVENWLAPGVSWHLSTSTLNPSWRAALQKHIQ